jgi:glycosyltransferase involved in cell wall biosynthesis
MRPIPLIKSQIDSKRKIVIVPGHTPNKGFSHIIKSIPYLHQDIVIVVLTGSRGKMPEFSPADKVIKLGWLSDEEYSWLLRSADCLAFLSDYEGFGIPIIEALQIGLPMILSMDPALIETAKGSGLIVDSSNPKQVGEAINLLTSNGFKVPIAPRKNWSQITTEIAKFVNE